MFLSKVSISDLLSLLFPNLCCGCNRHLRSGEAQLCSSCLYHLPFTDHHLHQENRVARQFWGRVPCTAAMALLYFKKGGTVQQLIHHLKYSDRQDLGIRMGNLLGEKLLIAPSFQGLDLLIPVPLHKKRARERGYNQSVCIATGIAQVLKLPVSTLHLLRKTATSSQTNKGRYLRYENMYSAFEVCHPEQLKGKHLLLVDDVLTTGATLEACATTLLGYAAPCKISIATLAFVG